MSDDINMKETRLTIIIVIVFVLGFSVGYGDGCTRANKREREMADRQICAMKQRMDELRGELRGCRRTRPATTKRDSTVWLFAIPDSDSAFVVVERP